MARLTRKTINPRTIIPERGTRRGDIKFGHGWRVMWEVDALHDIEEGKGYTQTSVVGYRVRIVIKHNSTIVHVIEDKNNTMNYSIESHRTKMKKVDIKHYKQALRTALEIYQLVKAADEEIGGSWLYWTPWRETDELARLLNEFDEVMKVVEENVRPAFA